MRSHHGRKPFLAIPVRRSADSYLPDSNELFPGDVFDPSSLLRHVVAGISDSINLSGRVFLNKAKKNLEILTLGRKKRSTE